MHRKLTPKLIDLFTHYVSREFFIEIYLSENKTYISKIAKKINVTSNHLSKLIKTYKRENLLITKEGGQIKIITLTPKGEKLAKYLLKIKTLLSK